MHTLRKLATWTSAASLGVAAYSYHASAQIFGPTPDIEGGIAGEEDVRVAILKVLKAVLNFMALIAVVFIVIAGIRLVVSQGGDEEKDKAKKTIIFVIVGLIVILLARAIVEFIADTVSNA